MRSPTAAAAILLATLIGSAHASADGQAYSEAAKHFFAGRDHVRHHRCDLAIPEFEASLSTEASVGAFLNLADCQSSRGALGAAWRAYKLAEELAQSKKDDRVREAHTGAATLEPKLLRVVVVAETPDGAAMALPKDTLTIDDESLPAAAIATGAMVDPGKVHALLVAPLGYEPAHATATGDAGETRMVRVPLIAHVAAVPEAAAPVAKAGAKDSPRRDPGDTQRTIAYVAAGVSAGALVVGAVFGFVALGQRSDLASAVAANPSCRGDYPNGSCSLAAKNALDPLESKAFTSATISTLLLAAGAAIGAGAVILYFTAPGNGPRIGAAGGPRAASLTLEQRF